MTPAVVVDVGNTRIKWGLCQGGAVVAEASLAPDDTEAWGRQLESWSLPTGQLWIASGVHPARCDALCAWLREQQQEVCLLKTAAELPLTVAVEHPDRVGIDRLLNAVAAVSARVPAIIVDAGSAVTVDWVDSAGIFRGGAIMPGLRLMARALHDYTALLPLVEVRRKAPPMGQSTTAALESGIYYAVVGGVRALVERMNECHGEPTLYLTGGDGALIEKGLGRGTLWPRMTMEGIRLAAEALA